MWCSLEIPNQDYVSIRNLKSAIYPIERRERRFPTPPEQDICRKEMAEKGHVDENQNAHVSVFHRLAGFPLVQSAYQIASFAYRDVKTVHPAVGYFCDVSERAVKVASDLATIGVAPLLKVMEPQITAINNVALQLVDGLENKLPVLDQPADEVVSEIRENVVSGVRMVGDRALERVQKLVDRTQTVARESYEVLSITTTFLATLEVQDMVKVATYFVLTQAEELVDRYLPEESDGGPGTSSSSDEIDETDGARFGLISRSQQLVSSVITRGSGKLRSFLDRYWNFLQGGVSLLLTIPSQVRRCVRAVLWSVLPQADPEEEAVQKSRVKKKKKKKKAESAPSPGRSPGKSYSNLQQGFVFRAAPKDQCQANDTERVRVRSQEGRRQSFDNSFFCSQEDAVDNVFYP